MGIWWKTIPCEDKYYKKQVHGASGYDPEQFLVMDKSKSFCHIVPEKYCCEQKGSCKIPGRFPFH